jgi:hypothetical protein
MRPCHVVRINSRRREDRLKSSIEITPGPSDYVFEKLESVKPAGPAYSLGKKYNDQKRKFIVYLMQENGFPGPNEHNFHSESSIPKITLKSRASPYVLTFPVERIDTFLV